MAEPRQEDTQFDRRDFERLARDLAELADARIDVPRRVDEAVLEAARRTLSPANRRRFRLRYAVAWTAAAAGLAIVVWLSGVFTPGRVSQQAESMIAVAGDLDRNGRVDILDAFALARHIEADMTPTVGDMNGDGIIDRTDVDAIAMLAVSLPKGAS